MTIATGRSARSRLIGRWPIGHWLLDGAVVTLVHGTLWWLGSAGPGRVLLGDEVTYRARALALMAGEPLAVDLMWPPLYAETLAALWRLTGPALAIVQLFQIALLLVSAWLFGRLGGQLGLSAGGQRVLRLAIASFPPLAAFAHYLWPEVLHLFFFTSALYCLIVLRQRTWATALSGVFLGLALLTKSLLTLFVPVLLAAVWWTGKGRRHWEVLAVMGCLALTVTPTLRSNHAATGRWVIADSSAFNLWVGLNDRSRRSLQDPVVWPLFVELRRQSLDWPEKNRWLWQRIGEHIEEHGFLGTARGQLERQYFRLLDKDSYLTDMLPGGLLHAKGSGYREVLEGVAGAVRWSSYLLYAVLLVATACGLAWRWPQAAWPRVLALFLLYNLALFFWLHVKTRYRVPMLPVCMFFAVSAGDFLASRLPISQRHWLVAAAGSAIALFLAFGGSWLD